MQFFENIMQFFITNASAAETTATSAQSQQGGSGFFIVMMVILLVFMYLVAWRPQSKRAKEHRNLMSSLAKDDEVVTAGGLLGKIVKVGDLHLTVALSDNVQVTMQKNSIVNVLPHGTLKSKG